MKLSIFLIAIVACVTAIKIRSVHGEDANVPVLQLYAPNVVIEGKNDRSCAPDTIELKLGQEVNIVLQGEAGMFMLSAPEFKLRNLMSMPGSPAVQTILPAHVGDFPFKCSADGALTKGIFKVR